MRFIALLNQLPKTYALLGSYSFKSLPFKKFSVLQRVFQGMKNVIGNFEQHINLHGVRHLRRKTPLLPSKSVFVFIYFFVLDLCLTKNYFFVYLFKKCKWLNVAFQINFCKYCNKKLVLKKKRKLNSTS